MTQPVDGVYDHTKPWRAPVQPDQVAKRWQYNGPWSTNAERLVSQALMVMAQELSLQLKISLV